ncbi:hypothetical protein R1sor_011721 [Riccia sorocarpa]|uniref:Serine aminopeptidase S33 domain-containing protein n=1 Tax=Riccia sorocarpa TaxID=122646 RepID=A0ABD3I5C1_9MARC
MPHPVVDANVDSIFGKYSPEEFYTRHGVVHHEAFIRNSSGLSLYTHSWKPVKGKAKGLVFVCHGYGSDSGWLVQLTAIGFAERGYSVHAIDHQGHGQSGGLKGYIPLLDAVIDDCIQFFDSVRNVAENSGLRSFLYGESMGGAIVLLITLRQVGVYSGVILNGAMLMISDKYKPPWLLELMLSFIAPLIHRWPIVPAKDIPTISFREEWKRTLALANPKRYTGRPRVGTAVELLRIVRVMEQRLEDVTVPFIALHGELDTVVDPAGSEALFEKARSTDKKLKVYQASSATLCHLT